MKLIKLYFLLLFIITACTKEIITQDNNISHDLTYLQNKSKPFTGKYTIVFKETDLPKAVFYYEKGKLKGTSTVFYKNGNKKWRGEYKQGLLEGKWSFWDEKGNLLYEVNFKNDSVCRIRSI